MQKNEILDQLHCLLELCETQVGLPNTHPMWEKDVEALAAVIEMLNQDQWIPVGEGMPKEHDSIFKKLRGTDQWKAGMFETLSEEVLVTVEFPNGKREITTCNTADGEWRLHASQNPKVTHWRPKPEPPEITAHWLETPEYPMCSNCNGDAGGYCYPDRCPICGAIMVKKGE